MPSYVSLCELGRRRPSGPISLPKEFQETGCNGFKISTIKSQGPINLYDIYAIKAAKCEDLVEAIHKLLQKSAVPLDERGEGPCRGKSGLWFVDPKKIIRKMLKSDGAHLILAVEKGELKAVYIYDFSPHDQKSTEKEIYCKLKKKMKGEDFKLGVASVVAVDPDYSKKPGSSKQQRFRNKIYRKMNSRMLQEAEENGITHIMGYVWAGGDFSNAALKSHSKLGWKAVESIKLEPAVYTDPRNGSLKCLQAQAVVMEVKSALKRSLREDRIFRVPRSHRPY